MGEFLRARSLLKIRKDTMKIFRFLLDPGFADS